MMMTKFMLSLLDLGVKFAKPPAKETSHSKTFSHGQYFNTTLCTENHAHSHKPWAFCVCKVLKLISTFRFDYGYDLLTFELVMFTAKSSAILVANRKATRFDPKTIVRIPVRQKFGRAKKLYS